MGLSIYAQVIAFLCKQGHFIHNFLQANLQAKQSKLQLYEITYLKVYLTDH